MVLHTKYGVKFFDDWLLFYIQQGYSKMVLSAIENVDVKNLVDSFGMTLLHYVSNADRWGIVDYLIKQGCEVDVLDNSGNTPLMNAVRRNHMAIILLLLEANADILLCGQGKENPLQMVLASENLYRSEDILSMFLDALKQKCSSDSRQIAKILMDAECSLPQAMHLKDHLVTGYMLNAGYDIHDVDPYYEFTALHFAVLYNDANNVKLLLQRGADIFAKDKGGRTPSDHYILGQEGSTEVLVALLHHDTSLSASTTEGYNFAAKVLAKGQLNEVEAILRYDFDFEESAWNDERWTLLHFIAENTNPGVMNKLEGRKFDVHARDIEGKTALWNAAYFANPSSLEFLFKHGADPNDENNEGHTVLYAGFQEWTSSDDLENSVDDNLKCLELFIECNVDILRRDSEGDTIFDICLNVEQFAFIQPVISQVAMMEASGRCITEDILKKFAKDKFYKEHFALCRSEIEKLRKTMINETVCLFQFLTESEEILLRYVRNCESAERLKQIISRDHNSDIFVVKLLRKRVQSILKTAKLRKDAASVISRMSGCNNEDVIERIILLLDKPSLENLCQVYIVSTNAIE